MPSQDRYTEILSKYWGYTEFRGIQREIIGSIGEGRDTLGLMPTGGGKSITFQVPALAMRGVCVVVTPLVALMKDQVANLRKRHIRAAALHAGLGHDEMLTVLDNCVFGFYKFLYVSPERLSSELFIAKLRHMEVSFFTVDEAHCISQWGHDFRPSYLRIADLRKVKPACPVLALTATATPEVAADIQRVLHFRRENEFRMSFHRPNLAYQVLRADYSLLTLRRVLESSAGSCIIYRRSRQQCEDLSASLNDWGISATYFHAGLSHPEKDKRQARWLGDEVRVMVATSAFGMGIDKADVRLVVHLDIPDSIEEYFQEAGRAGRDGKPARSVIILDGRELAYSDRRPGQRYPDEDYIRNAYEDICCYYQLAVGDGWHVTREFNVGQFCRLFHYHPLMLHSALTILHNAGYICYRDAEDGQSRVRVNATRNALLGALDARSEPVFMSLFRNYGGIFVDYVYIDEELVASETGLSVDDVYHCLADYSRRGAISYIPRKHVPHITFLVRRPERADITFPRAAYADRRRAFEHRLHAMQEYVKSTGQCRSVMLLRYFGEKGARPCGMCDVCLEEKQRNLSDADFRRIRLEIISLLREGPIEATSLHLPHEPEIQVEQVMDYMRAREELLMDGRMVLLGEAVE